MLCPRCKRENEPTSYFCIFCGAPLPAPEAESPQEQIALREEVRRLCELVTAMNNRLAALEIRQGVAAPPPSKPTPATPSQATVPISAAEAPPRKGRPNRVKKREWEQIFGGRWLARIGVLALVIGVAFFLKFAFDNNWIGPTGRIILGIIAGLGMLGLGYYWRKRYPILTQVLSGGGVAVLYLSIFAASAIYNMIHFYVAIAFLLLVSAASAALALRYNSMALAIIGILGAFITPFTLGMGEAWQLLAYVIVVDLGVLFLSTFRNWRWFTFLALVCSLVLFGIWYGEFGGKVSLTTAEVGITLIFLIFVGATTLFHIIWRRVPKAFDYTLMVLNASAYFGISLGLMWDDFRVWMGGFVLLLALFHGALSYIALKRSAENARLSLFALSIALVFLTVAVPIQLGDRAWTTIAWAVEATVLVWLSLTLRMPRLRLYSYVVFVIVAVRLLFFDTSVDISTFQPVLNERFLAFAVSIAGMYVSGYLLVRGGKSSGRGRVATTALLIAANFFSLWILSFEVWNSYESALQTSELPAREGLRNAQNLSLTAVWTIYAVIGLVIGIVKRWRRVRIGALILLAVPIVKVFVYDVFKLAMGYRIAAFVGLGVLLIVSGYLYQRYSKIIKGFFIEK
jgi:uncharacterized membrane protein